MQVKYLMNTNVKTVKADTSIEDFATMVISEKISNAPVVDNENNLIGIISEKDVLQHALPALNELMHNKKTEISSMEDNYKNTLKLKVKDLMCVNVSSVQSSLPCMVAASIMWVRNFRQVPVVSQGKLVGVISTSDIHQAIFKMNKDNNVCK